MEINGTVTIKQNDDGTYTYSVDGHELTTVSRLYPFAKVSADATHESGWQISLSMTSKRGYRGVA